MTALAARTRAARRRLDAKLAPLQPADRFAPPPRGWVKAIRTALGMSQADLAMRLGVTPQAVQQVEAGEPDGSVRLATLRRAADALGCDVVYALVPRTSLDRTVAERAGAVLAAETTAAEGTMALEAQAATLPQDVLDEMADRLLAARRLWRQ